MFRGSNCIYFYNVLLYWLSTMKFMWGPGAEERFLSSETEKAYVDCGTIIDKALVFSKGRPPPKSVLYFLESCCKKSWDNFKKFKTPSGGFTCLVFELFCMWTTSSFSPKLQLLDTDAKWNVIPLCTSAWHEGIPPKYFESHYRTGR